MLNNKDFEDIQNYAYKKATENLSENNEVLKDFAKLASRISAFSIAEYHRKVSSKSETHD
ncbi:hypothetical protein ACQKMD_01410 [Viridibacillus sp. NPDC096237]|uniref:hypothetical protein n=1 Tax=Viridibacillus sp. NPDC096237 TaxID=3390721 RepID=UPI003CFD345D